MVRPMLRLTFTSISLSCSLILGACGDAGSSGETSSGADSSSAASSSGPGSSGGETSSSETGGSTAPTSSSASDPTTTTAATTTDSTTGDAEFCQGWETADGEPYLVLHDRLGAELKSGGTLPLECGGQGIFMFGLYPTFGGFTPASDNLDFKLVVDVEGFNTNPEGHFYSADPVGYYVSCDPILGGVLGVLPVFPLDNLDDLTALDGKPAHVQVSMPTGGAPVVVELDLTLAVVPDASWDFCGG